MAGTTGLEPATSDVTGRRSNQLNYVPAWSRRSPSYHVPFAHRKIGAPSDTVWIMRPCLLIVPALALGLLAGCASKPTPEEAKKFIGDAEQKLLVLGAEQNRADWVKDTYITDDTEAIAAKLDERAINAAVDYAKQSTRFDGLTLDPETARKIKLLKLSLTIATPADSKESEELTRITSSLEGTYGKGK